MVHSGTGATAVRRFAPGADAMTFDLNYALEIPPLLLRATVVTFTATMGGMAIAIVGGALLAVMRMSRFRPLAFAPRRTSSSSGARRC